MRQIAKANDSGLGASSYQGTNSAMPDYASNSALTLSVIPVTPYGQRSVSLE